MNQVGGIYSSKELQNNSNLETNDFPNNKKYGKDTNCFGTKQ